MIKNLTAMTSHWSRLMKARGISITTVRGGNDLDRPLVLRGRIAGTRELVISRFPYLIPYRVRGGSAEILRVFHTARQWPTPLS